VDLRAHEWQVAVDYRYLHADRFYIGTQQVVPPSQFFGQPLMINVHSVDWSVTYAVSDRFNLRLTVPFSVGTQSAVRADTVRHDAHAFGFGDIGLAGNAWLLNPRTHTTRNIAVGAGVKFPTGDSKYADSYFLANHSSSQFPVDQSIELGDGGWGIILQGQAFQQFAPRAFAYFAGSYLVSPRNQTDAVRAPTAPGSTVHISVPDVYTGRLGVSYGVLPEQGLSVSLGGRVDGIPYHDLIGGSDGFRRPSVIVFLDPAVALERGPGTWTFGAPIRVFERLASANLLKGPGGSIGSGDLAGVLMFVGYARRF